MLEIEKEKKTFKKLYISSCKNNEEQITHISRNHAIVFHEMGCWKVKKGISSDVIRSLFVDDVEIEGHDSAFLCDGSVIQISSIEGARIQFFWSDMKSVWNERDQTVIAQLERKSEKLQKLENHVLTFCRERAFNILSECLKKSAETSKCSSKQCWSDDNCKSIFSGKATTCNFNHSCESHPEGKAETIRRITRCNDLYLWVKECEKALGPVRFEVVNGKLQVKRKDGKIHDAFHEIFQNPENERDCKNIMVNLEGNDWLRKSTQALAFYFILKALRNVVAHVKSAKGIQDCDSLLGKPEIGTMIRLLCKTKSVEKDLHFLQEFWPEN